MAKMLFMPLTGKWSDAEKKMFPTLEKQIAPQIHQLPLPDLLLFAYLLGMNNMQDALEQEKEPA